MRMLNWRLLGRLARISGLWGANSMPNHLSYDVLSRLVERRASPVEHAKAERHLASCGRCRSELAWLERIRTLPQRGAEIGEAQRRTLSENVGDGWGSFGRRPAAGDSGGFSSGSLRQTPSVSPYWLQGDRSPTPRSA
jgi:hypothetical protein